MILTGKHLSRRAVVRGVGAAIALPLLDAMVPALRPARLGAAAAIGSAHDHVDLRAWLELKGNLRVDLAGRNEIEWRVDAADAHAGLFQFPLQRDGAG